MPFGIPSEDFHGGFGIPNQEVECVKHPCINCVYFKACGETTRIEPCDGRMTKSEKKRESERK